MLIIAILAGNMERTATRVVTVQWCQYVSPIIAEAAVQPQHSACSQEPVESVQSSIPDRWGFLFGLRRHSEVVRESLCCHFQRLPPSRMRPEFYCSLPEGSAFWSLRVIWLSWKAARLTESIYLAKIQEPGHGVFIDGYGATTVLGIAYAQRCTHKHSKKKKKKKPLMCADRRYPIAHALTGVCKNAGSGS